MTRYEELKELVKNWRSVAANHEIGGGIVSQVTCDNYRLLAQELEAALALPEDSKVVNAELYGLAIALADSAARADIECLCGWTGADRGTYRLVSADDEHAEEVARAVRYLELREASGEPMPYRVVRDGDKVRFE